MISFSGFKKIELKIATVLRAERVEGSEKLMKLQVDLGENLGSRQIVAGIGLEYSPQELVGKQITIVANLEPKTLMGVESNGMLLAASNNGRPVLLVPDKAVPNGCTVK